MATLMLIILAIYLIGCVAALGYWLYIWFKLSMEIESYVDIVMFIVTFLGSWITFAIVRQSAKEKGVN